MIYGVGIDILRADRVTAVYEKFGERFAQRILLPEELEHFAQSRQPERFLAMRFAAKEAIVKAMGTGFAHGVWVRDSGVRNNRLGRPEIVFSARGRQKCDDLGIAGGHLTLSDEAGLVVAVAILMSKI